MGGRLAEVIADLRQALPEAAGDGFSRLQGLLESDEVTHQRVRGVRRRDQFLPILTDARFSVDIRLVPDDDESTQLAPVVVVRLEFDEQMFGADGVVFQALFGWLSAREARKLSTRPLESAERLMKATEQVNARTAAAMGTLTTAVTTHLSDLRAQSAGSAAKIDEIIRKLDSASTTTRRRT